MLSSPSAHPLGPVGPPFKWKDLLLCSQKALFWSLGFFSEKAGSHELPPPRSCKVSMQYTQPFENFKGSRDHNIQTSGEGRIA